MTGLHGLRPNHVAAGMAILLIALAIWPWVAPDSAPERSAPADLPSAPPLIAALPALATYSAVFERPLFTPSRRPAATPGAAVANTAVERYRLIGLLASGELRRALLADGDRRFEIAEGAALDGWTVARIEQDRIVLSSPAGKTVLKLRRSDAAPAEPRSGEPRPR